MEWILPFDLLSRFDPDCDGALRDSLILIGILYTVCAANPLVNSVNVSAPSV
jgi:hypothetical protein